MDKLQEWLRRIQRPPRREVANIDYWALLTKTRIAQEAGDVERAFDEIVNLPSACEKAQRSA